MRSVLQQALMGLDDNTHLHLSFDVDFLDPDIAPGVGTPVRGGPLPRSSVVHGNDCRYRLSRVA